MCLEDQIDVWPCYARCALGERRATSTLKKIPRFDETLDDGVGKIVGFALHARVLRARVNARGLSG